MTSLKMEKLPMVRTEKIIKSIPPDGGWGWMVLIGIATSNLFNQSMLSLFGLLYGDVIEAMGHKTQGAAVVLSTMIFVSNIGGPIAGVFLKLTSPRVAAVTGACFCTVGILLSGFATKLVHLTLTYGLLLGMGLGFMQNSGFVVINSYFKSKKSQAVGLANVGTGVGQTVMPHLVRYLLDHYGYTGACLILSGLSLHGIAGCFLIQPVQWHMKKVEEEVIIDENKHLLEEKHKNIVINKDETSHNGARRSTDPSIMTEKDVCRQFSSHRDLMNGKENNGKSIISNGHHHTDSNAPKNKSLWRKLYDLFDISLLSRPRFINIIIGTALCVASIQNFSMIFPFFLQKAANMNKHETAMCMSAVAFSDIIGRLVLPTIQDKYQIKARWMVICTNVWVLVVRQILAYQTDLQILLVMSCLYGVGRSMIVVARNIAISENVRMDQVPAAVGLGMLTMGVIVPPSYYLLGWIRDYTGSYIASIVAQNFLTLVLIVTWLPDMIWLWRKEKKQKQKQAMDIGLS